MCIQQAPLPMTAERLNKRKVRFNQKVTLSFTLNRYDLTEKERRNYWRTKGEMQATRLEIKRLIMRAYRDKTTPIDLFEESYRLAQSLSMEKVEATTHSILVDPSPYTRFLEEWVCLCPDFCGLERWLSPSQKARRDDQCKNSVLAVLELSRIGAPAEVVATLYRDAARSSTVFARMFGYACFGADHLAASLRSVGFRTELSHGRNQLQRAGAMSIAGVTSTSTAHERTK